MFNLDTAKMFLSRRRQMNDELCLELDSVLFDSVLQSVYKPLKDIKLSLYLG